MRVILGLLACGLTASCTQTNALRFDWEPPDLRARTARLELDIMDASCTTVSEHLELGLDDAPMLTVPAGDVCIVVRAYDATCAAFAQGRTVATFPPSAEPIAIVIRSQAPRGCRREDVCRNGVCVGGADIGPVVDAQSGRHHSCLVYASRDVQCFGLNRSGEIGQMDSGAIASPTTFQSLYGIDRLVLGGRIFQEDGAGGVIADVLSQFGFGCALDDGSVSCFGSNEDGQLGRGSFDLESHPDVSPVSLEARAVDVSVGGSFSCAVLETGHVWCWGRNQSGVLGRPSEDLSRSTTPIAIPGVVDATHVSAGHSHACLLNEAGVVRCWGGNFYGELGVTRNAVTSTTVPQSVVLDDVVEISAGAFHTCARQRDGAVSCWGWRQRGQTGPAVVNTARPALVLARGALQIDAAAKHTCARLEDGRVQCWGEHRYGQLGTGVVDESFASHAEPETVALDGAATSISCDAQHCCAVVEGGTASCWGRAQYGRLGDGDVSDHNQWHPVVVNPG